jgi:hypothetical protein
VDLPADHLESLVTNSPFALSFRAEGQTSSLDYLVHPPSSLTTAPSLLGLHPDLTAGLASRDLADAPYYSAITADSAGRVREAMKPLARGRVLPRGGGRSTGISSIRMELPEGSEPFRGVGAKLGESAPLQAPGHRPSPRGDPLQDITIHIIPSHARPGQL